MPEQTVLGLSPDDNVNGYTLEGSNSAVFSVVPSQWVSSTLKGKNLLEYGHGME